MIKAIETIWPWPYGDRFRSRLEARWAIFFDALGIEFEYEQRGYNLPTARYLPDFWLPAQKLWFEVKGPEPTEKETRLGVDLCALTGYRVALQSGNITPPESHIPRGLLMTSNIEREIYCTPVRKRLPPNTEILGKNKGGHYVVMGPIVRCYLNPVWIRCGHCGKWDLAHIKNSTLCYDCSRKEKAYEDWGKYSLGHRHERYGPGFLSLPECYRRARQARFEHGESPQPYVRR